MPPTKSTREEMYDTSVSRRKGDTLTGDWVCHRTQWITLGDESFYVLKGSRAQATWKFDEGWALVGIAVDTILPPVPLWERIKVWFGSNNLPPARTV